MAYGTIKVDNIIFTNGGSDQTVTVSGIVASTSGNLTVTGTISGGTVIGSYGSFTSLTGVTTSGTTANFVSGVFTTQVSGSLITGNTAGFTTVTGTTVTGTTANFVSGVFTTQVSGTTITGTTGKFTSITGGTAGFTTVTGTTVTGTTGNFVSGVFTTQVSGTTITGTTGQFTSVTGGTAGFTTVTGTTVTGTTANFATLSGTTITGGTINVTTTNITSGIFAAGSAAAPSIAFTGDTDTGIYSPGANQVAVATSGTARLLFNASGALGVGGANYGTAGQALISNGSSAVPTWQDLNTAVFGWDHDNDTYGLYLPGTSISTGALSGTINIDVQSRIRRCVINDAGAVQYYLDADDSTKKSGDWLRIVETESLATAYTGVPAAEATNSLLRVGVPAWAAGTFTRGQRVTDGGFLWECVAASSTATPAAGAVASVLDGTDGQVVVEIPAFSVRYGFINGVHTREVRLGCNDGLIAQGFRPHPAFIKTDDTYKSAFYWGAYQAYSDGTNLASVSGQTNTRSLTRATFRTRAALRGTGWHVQSYLELAAIQTLLVTEYRDYNSQKVLGNGSSEGGTYGVSTGLSNSRGNRSGNVYTGGGSSSDFMSYRGIENLYGRAWTWADGINVYERVVYLTNNQSVFADNTSVGYSFYAQVPSGSASYQKELFPLADVFLPSVVTGASSTTYLADGFWTGSGWRVALVGGSSSHGSIDGAFCLSLSDASGSTSVSLGARSAYAAN